jgi:DoxX-like protein
MSIYVEILVRAPMDTLWAHTQTPQFHEQWDLRFSKIDYIPRVDDSLPQRFRYATRIGFGLEVVGEGETTGHRELPDGSSTSVLKFASHAPLSIIRDGGGYWKYVPTRDGVRFLTWYDYRTRFGAFGVLFDRLVFRPLIGWATAWSFDRLRLWVEDHVHPQIAVRQTLIHVAARTALAIVFTYQGLVPKLLTRHVDEIALMAAAGVPARMTAAAVMALGFAELALAAVLVVRWSRAWPVWLCVVAMPIATITLAISSPPFFEAAFNPFSLNMSVAAIAAIDLFVIGSVPSAGRCRRRPALEKR